MSTQHYNAELYAGGTLGDIIARSLSRYPDRIAFVEGDRQFTYRETAAAISRIMQWFDSVGLQRGDTVAQLSRNCPEQWFVMAALYLSGLRSVTLHAMGGADDHTYILNDSEAKVVIYDAYFADKVAAYRPACAGVAAWYCHGEGSADENFWNAVSSFQPRTALRCRSAAEDIIRLAYTGGTTGKPKGVMLSNRALVANTMLTLVEKDWPEEVRVLCTAQISHGAGAMIVPTLSRGGTFYLYPGFDKDTIIAEVSRHRITVMYLVPTMIYSLLDYPPARRADWSSIALITYGASPMSPKRIEEAIAVFGPVMCQGYGQTEAPNSIAVLRKCDHDLSKPERLLSCGMPYPGIQVAILDEQYKEVPRGTVGEICVRGPIVMSGYWKQPEQTAEAFAGNWLHTGDMGCQDDDGFLYIVDRKKDMIISGGFNVYPREIENVLAEHAGVSNAAVIGVPDDKWGEAVKAVVVLRPGADVSAEQLIAMVKERKGSVNAPKSVDFIDAMPLTAVGKPDKKALRAKYWSSQARHVH
ncbi:Long-chain-fatty-acid--CoA ligase [Pigmentiphaga humi]|uniref:Long-chain-fatty-acid--CoA ligase n=1 Tax=Pigmentiphaga humi TaxID=2478468 RepID=A0A3P4AX94_9BURK|nr:AMP-binding protein [Pigmentiphaga humi]VCU68382.1 Long-chain-fatty-acid--CoA ligase [Pigmentiphaga humi]